MSTGSLARRPFRSVAPGRVFRAGLAALLFFLLPIAANAYTLVLRSGRHVTVPDDFRVTPAAITYEVSPGFWVTVWLSNVDVAATERANAEPAGDFAKRISREPEGSGVPVLAPQAGRAERRGARKVVTNRELEPARLRREAQEKEYERTRRGRGLPSKEEMQRRVEEQDRWLREWARQREAERLKAELEALRSELAEARRRLGELSLQLSHQTAAQAAAYPPPGYYPYSYAPPAQVITVVPFGHRGRFGRFGSRPHGRPLAHHPRPGLSFPPVHGRHPGHAWALPRALPPPAHAPRRPR